MSTLHALVHDWKNGRKFLSVRSQFRRRENKMTPVDSALHILTWNRLAEIRVRTPQGDSCINSLINLVREVANHVFIKAITPFREVCAH